MAVPIIGEQPFVFISCYPTTNIYCKCSMASGQLRFITIHAINIPAVCSCGRSYHVAGFNEKQEPVIVVTPPLPKM